jgi:hypothetical protein
MQLANVNPAEGRATHIHRLHVGIGASGRSNPTLGC